MPFVEDALRSIEHRYELFVGVNYLTAMNVDI
jgi:hypothetical protein